MTAILALLACLASVSCVVLLCHPLLRHLRTREIAGALFVALLGSPAARRQLRLILRARRAAYREDLEGQPPYWRLLLSELKGIAAVYGRILALAWQPRPGRPARRLEFTVHASLTFGPPASPFVPRAAGPRPACYPAGGPKVSEAAQLAAGSRVARPESWAAFDEEFERLAPRVPRTAAVLRAVLDARAAGLISTETARAAVARLGQPEWERDPFE